MWRRMGLGLLVVVLLIGGGVTAYQRIAAARVKSGFEAWTKAAQSGGWQVSWGKLSIAGWPRAAVIEVSDFRLAAAAPGGPAWESQMLHLRLDLFRPDHLTVFARGRQRAGIAGGSLHPFSARVLRLDLPFEVRPGAPIATVSALDLKVPDPGVQIGEAGVSVMALQPDLNVRITAGSIVLPAGEPWPLGSHLAEAAADAVLSGMPSRPGPPAELARNWQAAGGHLRITQGLLRWGPLDAEIEASGGLDPALQPAVSGDAALTGYAQALDVMVARHVMSNDAAFAAKAVLSLLAEAPAGGGAARVEAPFTVRDQVLSVGPIPLVRLRPIVWDGS